MTWQKRKCFTVVRAAARMAVLAKNAQRAREAEEASPLIGDVEKPVETPPRSLSQQVSFSLTHHSLDEHERLSPAPGQQYPWGLQYDPTRLTRRSSPPASERLHSHQEVAATHKTGCVSDLYAVRSLILGGWFNLLLVCVPLGFAAQMYNWGALWIFGLNFLSLIPLALLLGDVTEDLALRFGDVAGGLLNATFGNVTEIILSLSALNRGLYTVVAASLIGSILSNLLLVLGCCFFFGGLHYKLQTFNEIGNRACSSLLFLSALGVVVPTAAEHMIRDEDRRDDWVLQISRGTAIILFVTYLCYLYFQLISHRDLFQSAADGEEEEEADEPSMSLFTSLSLLTSITVLVAFASQFLTGSLEEVCKQTNMGQAFVGMIILPIAGNACEHITAVIVARKNKMDLAMGVAIGSSIQIATFAIPLAVLYAWATNLPFSLSLDPFSALALMLAVVHANFVGADATSHWLMGVQLIAVYLLIALTYFYR